MFCQKCGAELPDDATLCIKCGAKMYQPEEIKEEIALEQDMASAKSGKQWFTALVVIIVLLLGAAGLYALYRMRVSDSIVHPIKSTAEQESAPEQDPDNPTHSYLFIEQEEKGSQEPEQGPSSTLQDAEPTNIVRVAKDTFYGQWALIGRKENMESGTTCIDESCIYYLIITDTKVIYGSCPKTDASAGPHEWEYLYMTSGGINDANYLGMPEGYADIMIDSDGYINLIFYGGDGSYENGITVFERLPDGSLDECVDDGY